MYLWENLTHLFRYIYEGNSFKNIPEFKGELFKESLRGKLLIHDSIKNKHEYFKDCFTNWTFKPNTDKISELLGKYYDCINPVFINFLIISSFDFNSELDVNILGHIFENSITDIEALKKHDNLSKRKKQGVFYTPEHITDYICRTTIIPYLSKKGNITTVNELILEYKDDLDVLDVKLKNIKILDPACGSGAFLNKSTDILLEIHQALHKSKSYKKDTLDKYFDNLEVRKQVLKNNILWSGFKPRIC